MKNFLRASLMVAITMAGLGVLRAEAVDQPTVKLPYDQKGNPVSYGLAPVKYKRIAEVYETVVTSNSALLMGVIMSSVDANSQNYLTFRDTNSANGSGAVVIGKMMFLSTATVQSGGDFRLPHPVQFGKGITAGANGGAAFGLLGMEYTVLYLENR